MSNAPLTAKYRPQTFAQVAGQSTLKAILSRAALEDKTAPAYLFSGTRGVGKTTLARIFAKALNCRQAPAAEPCNTCDQCKAVTLGNAVDVIEIDGASNRGIDDIRRLKEVVGYAPMEGRYKIFIIDEAHMLSREAFNALLKTLEEPPARVTFIMATTEPHKFPATIISRCQHYVFKRLPESELSAHLTSVLTQEKILFDESAVRLIARRGAGSVRDAMSLLGQVLALGSGALTETSARGVLGLAGQEMLIGLAKAVAQGNTLAAIQTLHELMDQGLDIGFFLREFGSLWRNMFILGQSGEAALAPPSAIDLPHDEALAILELSHLFSLSHIHAAWQMTLEGQRRVLTSLEPGVALELLLLNLAMLPQLLSLDSLSAMARRLPPPATAANTGHQTRTDESSAPKTAASTASANECTAPTKNIDTDHALDPNLNARKETTTETPSAPAPTVSANELTAPKASELEPTAPRTSKPAAPTVSEPAAIEPQKITTAPTETLLKQATQTTETTAATQHKKVTAPTKNIDTDHALDPNLNARKETTTETPSAPAPTVSGPELTAPKTSEPAAPTASEPELTAPKASESAAPTVSEPAAPTVSEPELTAPKVSSPKTSVPKEPALTLAPASMEAKALALNVKPSATPAAATVFTASEINHEISGAKPAAAKTLHQPDWNEIVNACKAKDAPSWFAPLAGTITASWNEDCLCFQPKDAFSGQRMMEKDARAVLEPVLLVLCGAVPNLRVLPPLRKDKSRDVIKQEVYELPLVKELEDSLDARILDFGETKN